MTNIDFCSVALIVFDLYAIGVLCLVYSNFNANEIILNFKVNKRFFMDFKYYFRVFSILQ